MSNNQIYQDYRRSNVKYASISYTVPDNMVDFSFKSNTELFDKLQIIRELIIRNTGPIFIKLNDISEDPIEIFAKEGFQTSGFPVEDILITAAQGCVLRITGIGWN